MDNTQFISFFISDLIDDWHIAREFSSFSLQGLLSVLLLVIFGCIPRGISAQQEYHRYHLEVLDQDIDPALFPEQYAADFDGDGIIDHLLNTDSSLHITLSSGGRFDYNVSDMSENSATEIGNPVLLSFTRDGRFPSVIFPTGQDPLGQENGLVHQQIIYNDKGQLSLKTLAGYPLNGRAVDCAWIESNDLPVCFYASYGPDMGRSKLIELDPEGIWGIAHDRAYLAFRNQLDRSGNRIFINNDSITHSTAKERILAWRNETDSEVIDSLLAEGWASEATMISDSVRALALGLNDRNRIYCRDLTREYGLPWPVQLTYAYDQQNPEEGRFMDGYFMNSVIFQDFSGDGLLDMVVVGQHSSVFTAIQHEDGYFIDVKYHGLLDEYHKVRGPGLPENGEMTVPPCVLYSLEQDEASRSDYVECYDQISREWYELDLPQGPYWTEYDRIIFRDFDGDGMIDLAIPRSDSTWVAFKFMMDNATDNPH